MLKEICLSRKTLNLRRKQTYTTRQLFAECACLNVHVVRLNRHIVSKTHSTRIRIIMYSKLMFRNLVDDANVNFP